MLMMGFYQDCREDVDEDQKQKKNKVKGEEKEKRDGNQEKGK